MASRGHLRASDEDRERITERLRTAAAEGRITTNELEHRLVRALSARTYGELDALVADLPGKRLAHRQRQRSELMAIVKPAVALAIAIPVAFALVTAVFFVLTGAFTMWALWVFLGWWFFGHRHHRSRPPRRQAGWRPPPQYRAAHQRRGSGLWM